MGRNRRSSTFENHPNPGWLKAFLAAEDGRLEDESSSSIDHGFAVGGRREQIKSSSCNVGYCRL